MADKQRQDNSAFGRVEPIQESIVPWRRIVGVFLLGVFLVVAFSGLLFLSRGSPDRTPPKVDLTAPLSVLSGKGFTAEIVAADEGAGLKHINIAVAQDTQNTVLLEKDLDLAHEFRTAVDLSPAALQLKSGAAQLVVDVVDGAAAAGRTIRRYPFVVDLDAPTVAIIAKTDSFVAKGTGVVIYRATDKNLTRSGVKVGKDTYFPGVLLGNVDTRFSQADLFFALFTAEASDTADIAIVAEDIANNTARVPVQTSVVQRPAGKAVRMTMTRNGKDSPARQALLTVLNYPSNPFSASEATALTDRLKGGDLISEAEVAKALIATALPVELEMIRASLRGPAVEPRSWDVAPLTGMASPRAEFGDILSFTMGDGKEAFSRRADFQILDPVAGEEDVLAPYNGTVRFARDLGVLGQTIVIEHGAGMATMYTSLSNIFVDVGAPVERGQRVAQIGSTGLEFSRALRLFILVNGYPVDPADWMDRRKFLERIEGPLNSARTNFGITIMRSGERL